MKKLVAGVTLGLVGGVTAGLIGTALPTVAHAATDQEQAVIKRKDDMAAVLVAVDDEDDDDTYGARMMDHSRDTSVSKSTRGTGSSRSRRDGTNSRYSPLSRDRDGSRGDKTKDFTWDGKGDKKRDWSRNHTNDRSRNDTRNGGRA